MSDPSPDASAKRDRATALMNAHFSTDSSILRYLISSVLDPTDVMPDDDEKGVLAAQNGYDGGFGDEPADASIMPRVSAARDRMNMSMSSVLLTRMLSSTCGFSFSRHVMSCDHVMSSCHLISSHHHLIISVRPSVKPTSCMIRSYGRKGIRCWHKGEWMHV